MLVFKLSIGCRSCVSSFEVLTFYAINLRQTETWSPRLEERLSRKSLNSRPSSPRKLPNVSLRTRSSKSFTDLETCAVTPLQRIIGLTTVRQADLGLRTLTVLNS